MGRTWTVRKSRPRDASTKVAEHRLSVLELARELGNVAEACRRRGMDRTSFYEWKRRFQCQSALNIDTGRTYRQMPDSVNSYGP